MLLSMSGERGRGPDDLAQSFKIMKNNLRVRDEKPDEEFNS